MREKSKEELEKIAEEWRKNNPQPPFVPSYPPVTVPNGCPNCGYCQHCGRGGHRNRYDFNS